MYVRPHVYCFVFVGYSWEWWQVSTQWRIRCQLSGFEKIYMYIFGYIWIYYHFVFELSPLDELGNFSLRTEAVGKCGWTTLFLVDQR